MRPINRIPTYLLAIESGRKTLEQVSIWSLRLQATLSPGIDQPFDRGVALQSHQCCHRLDELDGLHIGNSCSGNITYGAYLESLEATCTVMRLRHPWHAN